MNKEGVNEDVKQLVTTLVTHLRSDRFKNASAFVIPTRTGTPAVTPAGPDAYYEAVRVALGLDAPVPCTDKGSMTSSAKKEAKARDTAARQDELLRRFDTIDATLRSMITTAESNAEAAVATGNALLEQGRELSAITAERIYQLSLLIQRADGMYQNLRGRVARLDAREAGIDSRERNTEEIEAIIRELVARTRELDAANEALRAELAEARRPAVEEAAELPAAASLPQSAFASSGAASGAASGASVGGRYFTQYGGALELPQLSWVITKIMENSVKKSDYILHKGKQVLRIPDSNEMAKRFCAPLYINYIGVKVDNVCDAMTLETYKTIPGGLEDSYVASLGLNTSDAKSLLRKWDECVKSIRDKLADAGLPSAGDLPNKISLPVIQTVSKLSTINPIVLSALTDANNRNPSLVHMVQPPSTFFNIRLNSRQSGGASRNRHAPLYPKLVMNGGSSPFATYGGSAEVDNMVSVIENKIKSLYAEYKSVSGQEIDTNIKDKITDYVTQVRSGFESLEKDLKNLRDANSYLAQNPLSEGLPRPNSIDGLASLAESSREVTAKALRLGKQFDKMSQMEKLLAELVKNSLPKA